MYCICCKKDSVFPEEIDRGSLEEEILWDKNDKNDYKATKGGIIQKVSAGYGSIFDGDRIILAICDDCIKENIQDGTLLFFDNYFSYNSFFVEDHIEKSKKVYRRRKNLDKLIDLE